MNLQEAINLIRPGVLQTSGTWADIGAGTGLFTEALMKILDKGKIFATDKNPHSLYANEQFAICNKESKIEVEILEADFNLPLTLPLLDGILMANALHYGNDHYTILKNVISVLKPGGTFLLIEYDTVKPNPPWVPNPVSLKRFMELCNACGLKEPMEIGRRKSIYRDGEMYVALTTKA